MDNPKGRGMCAGCNHPKSKELNAAIKNGASMSALVETYGISRAALYRHKAHIGERDPDKTKTFEEKTSLERINEMEKFARHFLGKAAASGDTKNAVAIIRAANESISLAARLRGEMSGKPIEVAGGLSWSDFNRFTDTLLAALEDQPEAKKAVLTALLSVGGDHAEDIAGGA